MDLVIRTGFQGITHSLNFNPQGIIKGKALSATHVVRVEEVSGIAESYKMIRASVIRQTSVTLPPYKVQIRLDAKRHTVSVSCTCVSQAGEKCKHIYALIHYINTDRSSLKTTLEQEWGRPSDLQLGKEMYAKPIVVTDVFECKKHKEANIVPYDVSYSDVANQPCALRTILWEQNVSESTRFIKSILKDILYLAISRSEDGDCEACALNLINLCNDWELHSPEIIISDDQQVKFYYENVHLTHLQIIDLCKATQNQSDCKEWFLARHCRISASSKAHAIKTRTKKDATSLVTDFLNPKSKNKFIPALEYGKKNERNAISEYKIEYGVDVKSIGVFVMPSQPWLCASADGIVIDDGCISKVLEVKCPSSCRSKPVFDKDAKKFNVPYLYLIIDVIELKTTHKYYTQCQILMYVMGLSTCDFYVWSPKGSCLTEVHRDMLFLRNAVPALKDFYSTHFLKSLCEVSKQNLTSLTSDRTSEM